MDKINFTAPCGIDCFNCEVFESNITPQLQRGLAQKLGKKEDEVPCKGCRKGKGCILLGDHECATRACVMSQNLNFCYECNDFPCSMLLPCNEGADKYPHNLKLYNLCRIQKSGIEQWAQKEAKENRQKYFKGKFVIGRGPLL